MLFLSLSAFAQSTNTSYPPDYFRSPLDIPLFLSGSFGELRANHFHAGLDFKTQQKEGFAVIAAADGYVSRIKISPFGYGKAIYIDHPNGYTTVYGHLQKGYGAVEAFIRKQQYDQQNFEIEVFPEPGQIAVHKGDTIALSGNTGGSAGPHLHFEVRDTKSEKIINPLFFGFDKLVADARKPVLTGMIAYPIGPGSSVNQSQRPVMVNLKLQEDGTYIADAIEATGQIAFAVNTYDQSDGNYTKHGVYRVRTYVNGTAAFGYELDTFAFDESRYVNALLDYPRFRKTGMRLQKLFWEQPYGLSLIEPGLNAGIVTVLPNLAEMYRVEIADFNGNTVTVTVPIEYTTALPDIAPEPVKTTAYFLKSTIDNVYRKDNVTISIPAGTFYNDFYLDFSVENGRLHLHDDSVPVHRNFTISMSDPGIPEANRKQTFIGTLDGSKPDYNVTKWENGVFTCQTKDLGDFALVRDTIAPTIKPLNFKEAKWISENKTVEVQIKDDLSGIKSYNGYLNGKWVLFEYDYKSKKLTYDFSDGNTLDGRNELKMVVTDNVGNSAIFETWFFRASTP